MHMGQALIPASLFAPVATVVQSASKGEVNTNHFYLFPPFSSFSDPFFICEHA